MNSLKQFFLQGFADQLLTAGEPVTIYNPKSKISVATDAVVTETSGNTTVEIGSILYTVDAHALIPSDVNKPNIGEIIKTETCDYKIISVVRSIHEAAWSCNLIKI